MLQVVADSEMKLKRIITFDDGKTNFVLSHTQKLEFQSTIMIEVSVSLSLGT